MQCRIGNAFREADPAEVIDFLKNRKLESIVIQPDRLHMTNHGDEAILELSNGRVRQFPVRRTFIDKLLRWFDFPLRSIRRLSTDTVTSILNDHLLAIQSGDVTVRIENDDAVSITSSRYSPISDLEVLELARRLSIGSVTRDDFFMRVYTEIQEKTEPVPGDFCGLGYNIFNSETGFMKLSVQHFILRYLCTNGAVVRMGSGSHERVHYGQHEGGLQKFLAGEINRREHSKGMIVDAIRMSTDRPAHDRIDAISRRFSGIVGRGRAREIFHDLPEDATQFQVANMISREGHTLDAGQRLQDELLAGRVLFSRNP